MMNLMSQIFVLGVFFLISWLMLHLIKLAYVDKTWTGALLVLGIIIAGWVPLLFHTANLLLMLGKP